MDPISLAMLVSGGLSAVTSIFGGFQQESAQDKALKAQTKSTQDQLALSKEIFASNKAGAQPWIDAGKQALTTLIGKMQSGAFDLSKYGMSDLIDDPGYQFRVQQGEQGLNRAASARGKFLGGDQIKALDDYNQESASQEFGNAFARTQSERNADYGRLQDVSTQGLSASNAMSGVSTNFAANQNNIMQNQASAAGNAAVSSGNIWANTASNVAKVGNNAIENWALYDRLAKAGIG